LIAAGKCKFVIHPDNSRCRTAKVVLNCVSQEKVRFAPSSIFPRDSTIYLFLFGYVKHKLQGSRFQTVEEFLAEVRKLVGEIAPENLLDGFHD
jgi:hypothetical protein